MHWKRIPRFWYSRRIPPRGFRIVSGTWILDSDRYWDSGFLELYSGYQSPGFQIPQAKISRIPSHGATQIEYFPEWAQLLEWTVLVLCFVFPIQSTWYSQENLPVAFSYLSHMLRKRKKCEKKGLRAKITWSEMEKRLKHARLWFLCISHGV